MRPKKCPKIPLRCFFFFPKPIEMCWYRWSIHFISRFLNHYPISFQFSYFVKKGADYTLGFFPRLTVSISPLVSSISKKSIQKKGNTQLIVDSFLWNTVTFGTFCGYIRNNGNIYGKTSTLFNSSSHSFNSFYGSSQWRLNAWGTSVPVSHC